ncbi:MAG: amino acid adenylation domain-containing protein, partial [bacterium]|nr:amino acid adenylation domain-containing protein [bacterium]
ISFKLNEDDSAALRETAKENEATLYMTILSIFTILLSKLSGQEDIIVGTPTAGRRHAELENIIGMFVNTLAMRNYPEGGKTIEEYRREVKENTLQAFENQDYQFEDLVERLSVRRDTGRNPIFDVMFNLLNQSEHKEQNTTTTPINSDNSLNSLNSFTTSKFDLTLSVSDAADNLYFNFEYCTKLFTKATVNRFITYFKGILQTESHEPHQKISDIEIITEEEKKQILYEFNDTAADYPRDKTIHQLFAEQVERTPDRISVVGSRQYAVAREKIKNKQKTKEELLQMGGADGGESHESNLHTIQITYRELNEKANLVASHLLYKGVEPGSIVGIKTGRTLEMITGILAILKASAAYLPIDPTYPAERIQYMLADSNTAIVITDTGEPGEINEVGKVNEIRGEVEIIDILDLDKRFSTEQLLMNKNRLFVSNGAAGDRETGLAYTIYTSGSTGKPKGVMIEHAALLNFIKGMTDIIEFKPKDCILSLTTICFDIFGLETLLPLTTGTKIVIGGSMEQGEPYAAGQIMKQEHVSIFQATPSRLQLLLSEEKSRTGLAQLNALLVGGEALPLKLLEEARKLVPGKIYNVYGPTETTIWSTVKDVTGEKVLNIGTPIANTQIYILDGWDKLQPKGVAGELYIGGDGLARGYINKPELTAERFTKANSQLTVGIRQEGKKEKRQQTQQDGAASSFPNNQYQITNNTLYRTGDLARWLPDGNIEFLGRIDHQVKIRGFRIELGEIENRLLSHPEISEAAVLSQKSEDGDNFLCAYYVERGISHPESYFKDFLSQFLPDYMIPPFFIKLEKIPLTPNGKIDRKALPQAPISNIQSQNYIAPRNDIEENMAEIWADILGIPQEDIGIDSDFFQIGGHSLKATVMAARIH